MTINPAVNWSKTFVQQNYYYSGIIILVDKWKHQRCVPGITPMSFCRKEASDGAAVTAGGGVF